MRYTGPKRKLCRREQINLFGTSKYTIKKWEALPGKAKGARLTRLSEYGKLLRNKQTLKRIYQMSERQFSRLVNHTALKISKNQGISHDGVIYQLLERRVDTILVRAGVASTIMQARQMITHGHWLLNDVKHNIPSYYMKPWDVLSLRKKLQNSPLYSAPETANQVLPFWIKVNPSAMSVELTQLPETQEEREIPADLLKVIEFYARV